jgi:type I restriction enzyme S subunit
MSLATNSLYIFESNNWVSEADLIELRAHPLPPMSVVFGKIGEGLKRNRYRVLTRPTLIDNNMMGAVPNSLVDHRFFAIVMSQIDMGSLSEGSALPYLRAEDVGNVRVLLPPLTEQRVIAEILGALDDKIESNLRTWRLSTELVQSEYKSLVSGEIGLVTPLRSFCDFNVRTLKPGKSDEVIRYIDISSVEAGLVTGESETTWADAPSRARRSVADGDVIFSTVRPARMAYSMMFDPDSSTVVSTGFAVMSPKGVPSTLLFAVVSDDEFGKYCESVSQGSAYPAVSPDAMGNYEVQFPEKDMIRGFGERTEPILRRAHKGLQENKALSRLRDALLPELLSGRLRVKDAESMMENV